MDHKRQRVVHSAIVTVPQTAAPSLPPELMRIIILKADFESRIRLMRVGREWEKQVRAVCEKQKRVTVIDANKQTGQCHNRHHQVPVSMCIPIRVLERVMGRKRYCRRFWRLFPNLTVIAAPGICVTSYFLSAYWDKLTCLIAESVSRETGAAALPLLKLSCLNCESFLSWKPENTPLLTSVQLDMDISDSILCLNAQVTHVSASLKKLIQLSEARFSDTLTHLVLHTVCDCFNHPDQGIFGARHMKLNFPSLKLFILSEKDPENVTHETIDYWQNPPVQILDVIMQRSDMPKLRVFGIAAPILSDFCTSALCRILTLFESKLSALCIIGADRGLMAELLSVVTRTQPSIRTLFLDPLLLNFESAISYLNQLLRLKVFGTHIVCNRSEFLIAEEIAQFGEHLVFKRLTDIHFKVDSESDRQLLEPMKHYVQQARKKRLKHCRVSTGPLIQCFVREVWHRY